MGSSNTCPFVLAHTLARHCGSSPALTRLSSSLPGRAERRVTRQSKPPPCPPPQAGEGAERSEAGGGSLLFMPSARNADGSAPWTAGSSPAVTTCLRLRRTILVIAGPRRKAPRAKSVTSPVGRGRIPSAARNPGEGVDELGLPPHPPRIARCKPPPCPPPQAGEGAEHRRQACAACAGLAAGEAGGGFRCVRPAKSLTSPVGRGRIPSAARNPGEGV